MPRWLSWCGLSLIFATVLFTGCDPSPIGDVEDALRLRRRCNRGHPCAPSVDAGVGDEGADLAAADLAGELGTSPDLAATEDLSPPLPGSAVTVAVRLIRRLGSAGAPERINFAIPLPPGLLFDPARIRVVEGGQERSAARRRLAVHPDGSARSVQLQVELALGAEATLQVQVGEPPQTAPLGLVAVEGTLAPSDGTAGPRVWAMLPPAWLSDSGLLGPLVPESAVAGTALAAWSRVCDYARYDVDAFLALSGDASVWLYDRATVFYRGHAQRGDLGTLETAYREAAIYRAGITGSGASTAIPVPGKSGDLKYHYAQNLAVHYLLTGDDRFREAAENVADRIASLWTSPGYAGGADFWTERHAGFALLAYVSAMAVSDDRAARFRSLADQAVLAYAALQDTYPIGYNDPAARCFAHSGAAHGESYPYFGCSPWMSAILADGLEVYARERGGAEGALARAAILKLGRALARDGRDPSGRPYYWMGVGTSQDDVDPYDEHWGESAYVIAMAWHLGGRTEVGLRTAADQLVAGLGQHGEAPHLRSFNWQCRSAVATPAFLR